MTRDETLNLEGLELRKAVAEARRLRIVVVVDPEVVGVYLQGGGDCPAFESDMNAAWPLIDQIGPTSFRRMRLSRDKVRLHLYWRGGTEEPDFSLEASGKSDPEAICRAYLMAKEMAI
jgi:hypothetical protein